MARKEEHAESETLPNRKIAAQKGLPWKKSAGIVEKALLKQCVDLRHWDHDQLGQSLRSTMIHMKEGSSSKPAVPAAATPGAAVPPKNTEFHERGISFEKEGELTDATSSQDDLIMLLNFAFVLL